MQSGVIIGFVTVDDPSHITCIVHVKIFRLHDAISQASLLVNPLQVQRTFTTCRQNKTSEDVSWDGHFKDSTIRLITKIIGLSLK